MNTLRLLVLASVGGGLGAGLRFGVNAGTAAVFGPRSLPAATLVVNVVGSFAMGLVVAVVAQRFANSAELRTFLATGILGGFTTFSAFSLDAVTLADGSTVLSAAYVVASVLGSILALLAGLAVARWIAP